MRSTSSSAAARVTAGTANSTISAIERIDQAKMGMRLIVIPGARILKMVTMKLTAPTVVDSPVKITPRAQKSMFRPAEKASDVSGTYANQPPSGGRPTRYEEYMKTPDNRYTQ